MSFNSLMSAFQRVPEKFCLHLHLNSYFCLHLLFLMSLLPPPQWPHPPDGDRDQSGCGSGAEDPGEICWPRVRQRENLCFLYPVYLNSNLLACCCYLLTSFCINNQVLGEKAVKSHSSGVCWCFLGKKNYYPSQHLSSFLCVPEFHLNRVISSTPTSI